MSYEKLRARIERLKKSIPRKAELLITMKDGSQVKGDIYTALNYVLEDPSPASRIEDITQGKNNGELPALLNGLLEDDTILSSSECTEQID